MSQFGMWMFDENLGLIGRPENLPELYLSTDKLWDIEDTNMGQVWKWPIRFASMSWFTPSVADDFNKAFFYAQRFFEGFRPVDTLKNIEIDARTVQFQTELLSDYFPGPEDDLSARA